MFYEGKAHDYGLVVHGISQRFLWTRLPYMISFEPRWPSSKLTPSQAFLKLVENVLPHCDDLPFHILSDSNFVAKQTLQELRGLNCLQQL